MNLQKYLKGLFISFAILCAIGAQAIPVDTTGVWTDIEENNGAVANVNGLDTNNVTWGIPGSPGDPSSGYDFEGVSDEDAPLDGDLFPLGNFTHDNFPIQLPSITGADLDVMLEFPDEGINQNFMFFFAHNETPNTPPPPCLPGTVPPCPDEVTIPDASSTETIQIMDMIFVLTIVGFSQDDGNTITDGFITAEGQANTATLYARLDKVVVGPEPSTLSLMGLGLTVAGLGLIRRRRRG